MRYYIVYIKRTYNVRLQIHRCTTEKRSSRKSNLEVLDEVAATSENFVKAISDKQFNQSIQTKRIRD